MKTTSPFIIIPILVGYILLSLNTSPNTSILSYYEKSDLVNFSSDPPPAKTGAPNESTCTDCHAGAVLSAIGNVDFTFDAGGTATEYVTGQTYPMQISVPNGSKNGFQLTILTSNNQKAGSFVNGPNTSTVLALGREYIRHSTSSGITTFDFSWTAPSTNVGDVRAYFSFNKSNNNGLNIGDQIFIGDLLIPSNVPVSVNEFNQNPNKTNAFWDANAKQINLIYTLQEERKIVVSVQNLNGQLVQQTTLGIQGQGDHQQKIEANHLKAGLYIVAIFVNNRVYNHKILVD